MYIFIVESEGRGRVKDTYEPLFVFTLYFYPLHMIYMKKKKDLEEKVRICRRMKMSREDKYIYIYIYFCYFFFIKFYLLLMFNVFVQPYKT